MSTNKVITEKVCSIFQDIQHLRLIHQANATNLEKLYDAVSFEDFVGSFISCIRIMFNYEIDNGYVLNCMKFATGLVANIARRDDTNCDSEEAPTHPLLGRVIIEVLKHHDKADLKQRYHACNFITLVLDSIGENANLDNDLCDEIQKAMLERIRDPKAIIRERSIQSLQRLQDPVNNECPVIAAFENSLRDPSSAIRAAAVRVVAPRIGLVEKIVELAHDSDFKVRRQVFIKLSQLKPKNWLTIPERQAVLQCGFKEANRKTGEIFREVLLVKWLAAFDGNYLHLLKAIRLDADEEEIRNTDAVSTDIIKVFLKMHSIKDVLAYLPLDDDGLIPYDQLLVEVVSFWNIMAWTLSEIKGGEEIFAKVVPDLLPFCKYINKYITEKSNSDLETWQFLEYQFVLLKLFNMIQAFDLTDEAGRKELHQLVTETLLKRSLSKPVISMLLRILEKLNPNTDSLIEEVIDIIANILHPVVEVQSSSERMQEVQLKLAELSVKINILYEEVDEAIDAHDLRLAAEKEDELKLLKAQKSDLNLKMAQAGQKKQHSKDGNHKCKPFDVLNALLELDSITKLNQSLKLFKNELLTEMEAFADIEHHKSTFKSCCLYAVVDRECAQEYLKFIYSPLLIYGTTKELDVMLLQRSMMTVCDLLFLYGPNLFKSEESDKSSSTTITKRKLYNPDSEEIEPINQLECSAESLIKIIVSMVKSEVTEIKETACKVMGRLVYSGVCVSCDLLTCMLIEWCNPVGVNPIIHTMFGLAMFQYAHQFRDSHATIETSVIAALGVIGNAPKTSPLADVNVDPVIAFICDLTRPMNQNSIVNTHKALAYTLCSMLDKSLEDKCAIIWAKLLLALEPPHDDKQALDELKCQVEDLLGDVTSSNLKNKLKKYVAKLINEQNRVTETMSETISKIDVTSNDPQEKSDKRLASGSNGENSPRNPKKKAKLGQRNDDANLSGSIKRVLSHESDSGHEEKKQRLLNCVGPGEEIDTDGSVVQNANGAERGSKEGQLSLSTVHDKENEGSKERRPSTVHDKENVVQRTGRKRNKAVILQNLTIRPKKRVDKQSNRETSNRTNRMRLNELKSNPSNTSLPTSSHNVTKKEKKKISRTEKKYNSGDSTSLEGEDNRAVNNKHEKSCTELKSDRSRKNINQSSDDEDTEKKSIIPSRKTRSETSSHKVTKKEIRNISRTKEKYNSSDSTSSEGEDKHERSLLELKSNRSRKNINRSSGDEDTEKKSIIPSRETRSQTASPHKVTKKEKREIGSDPTSSEGVNNKQKTGLSHKVTKKKEKYNNSDLTSSEGEDNHTVDNRRSESKSKQSRKNINQSLDGQDKDKEKLITPNRKSRFKSARRGNKKINTSESVPSLRSKTRANGQNPTTNNRTKDLGMRRLRSTPAIEKSENQGNDPRNKIRSRNRASTRLEFVGGERGMSGSGDDCFKESRNKFIPGNLFRRSERITKKVHPAEKKKK